MNLDQILRIAQELSMWIHERINEKEVLEQDGLKLLQQSQDLCDAVRILIESNLRGPAHTLARPMFDAFVRGVWLFKCASDDDIEKFLTNDVPGNDRLLREIEKINEPLGAWIKKTSELNRNDFNDLTHGGIQHVKRRSGNNSIEPNYPDEELIRLMHIQIEIQFAIGEIFLDLRNDQEGLEKLYEMMRHYRLNVQNLIQSVDSVC